MNVDVEAEVEALFMQYAPVAVNVTLLAAGFVITLAVLRAVTQRVVRGVSGWDGYLTRDDYIKMPHLSERGDWDWNGSTVGEVDDRVAENRRRKYSDEEMGL